MNENVETSKDILEEALKVRVRYSTIINYVSQIYRLIIAIGFTVIVTRKLSVEEYGLFTTIMGLSGILTGIYQVWGFWVARFYARGKKELASTAFALNLLYAPITSILMILLGLYYNNILGWGFPFFLIGALIPMVSSLAYYLRSIAICTRPYIVGQTSMIRETVRFLTAYIFVVALLRKLMGALISISIAVFIASLSSLIMLSRKKIEIPKPYIKKEHLIILFKNSYIPALATLYSIFTQLERPLLTAITASTIATAYIGISYIPRSVILQSTSAFTSGLSARLLRIPSKEDIEDVLRTSIIINVGFAFLLISMSIPILSLFRIEYINASILFVLFTIESLLIVISDIFSCIAISLERKDLYEYGKALIDTPLFKIPIARFLRSIISIICGSISVAILIIIGITDPVLIALPYPILWLLTSIPYIIYTYKEARRKIKFDIPWREVCTSIIAGSIASAYLFLSGSAKQVIKSFWLDTQWILLNIIVGLGIYISLAYLLSPWLRNFIRKSLQYYRTKM